MIDRGPVTLQPAHREAVLAAWSTPGRCYHTLDHLHAVLAAWEAEGAEEAWERPVETWLAVLYHDAVYVIGQPDNEARSAALAAEHLARWPIAADVNRVAQLITLTAAHGHLRPGDVDAEAARFLDCDMAILGAPDAAFDTYDERVRAEWSSLVDDAGWRAGRGQFARAMLSAPQIFLSPRGHAALEQQARRNLARLVARYGG